MRIFWSGIRLWALLLAAAALTGAAAPAAAPGAPEAQIRALELAHNEAIAHGDAQAFDRLTRDDFTFITGRGFLLNKAQTLKGISDGAFRYEYRQISDLSVRVLGDAAVVTGRSLHTLQRGGREYSDVYRYMRVYAREGDSWRAVAWQATVEDEEARP